MNSIKSYVKVLDSKLIPALSDKLEMKLSQQVNYTRTTQISYAGSNNDDRVVVKFSSNHIELKDYGSNYLYVDAYYNLGGTSAGIIDLLDIEGSVEQIYGTLYELGFRTTEDLENEEKERQKQEEQRRQEELEKEQRKKEVQRIRQQNDENKQEEPVEDNEEINANESQESIDESNLYFDKYLNTMKKENMINSSMSVGITIDGDREGQYKNLSIDMYYISSSMCLVQTSGITPKVDKAVTWDKAKDYYTKVAEKLDGVVSISAEDSDGNELNVELEDTSNDVDVGVNI